MTAMSGIADMCASMGKRLDALEKPEARADMHIEGGKGNIKTVTDGSAHPAEPWEARRDSENRERDEKAVIQSRCDSVACALGERAPAPMVGERARDYRVRLLKNFQRYSKEFAKVDLSTVPAGAMFDGIEARICSDALEAASHPTSYNGELRPIIRYPHGPEGHKVIEYAGTFDSCFGQFKRPAQRVEVIDPKRARAA